MLGGEGGGGEVDKLHNEIIAVILPPPRIRPGKRIRVTSVTRWRPVKKNNLSFVALQLRGRGLMWWLHLWTAPNWLWRISPFMTDLLIHQFDNDENDSETRTATKTIDRPLSLWISHNNRRDLWIMTLLPTLILDHQFKAENSLFLQTIAAWSVADLPRQYMWWMENKSFVKIVELKLTSLFLYPRQNFTFDNTRQPKRNIKQWSWLWSQLWW